jgi:2',3'-cyclic-nucleotide 2'-phosphodiesterase (5'-nucleotidase family)
MEINKINPGIAPVIKNIKKEDNPLNNIKDTVDISSYTQNEKAMDITLDINGKTLQKKILGKVTENEIILNIKHSNDAHGNVPFIANSIKPEEFWVDAGDEWQGYDFSSIVSSGRKEVDMMNRRDCDIAVPGNHFYDDAGQKGAQMMIDSAKFPYISSNITGMAPYTIADVEGVKIGFIGARTQRKRFGMVDPSKVKDVELTDPVEAIKKSVSDLKAKGINNIIVISHLGLEATEDHPEIEISDKYVAEHIPGIDLIIGGHTHTATKEKVEVNGTRIVQAGIDGHGEPKKVDLFLGDVSLTIDKGTGKIKSIDHKLIKIDRNNSLDNDIKNINDRYVEEEKTILGEKLGKASEDFTHDIKTPADSTLGNLITDAMREETGADIAILDSNFFVFDKKAPPVCILPEGEVTMESLVNTSPWMGKSNDSSIETWEVRGEAIKKLLEEGVDKLTGPKKYHGLYQVSGLKMSYNLSGNEGKRVTELLIGDKPLDPDKNYKITTSYYQGNWNPILSEGRNEETVADGRKIRDIVADYVKKHENITPEQGRIVPEK